MKVVCESCQAKYQVPDERVAGKKLKIRCKRCGATVLIRGDLTQTGLADGAEQAPQPELAAAVPAAELEWHASIDGQSFGPFDTSTLLRWLDEQPGGWDAHVWRDGFSDWVEVRACPELMAAAPAMASPASVPPESEAPQADFSGEDEDGPTRTFGTEDLAVRRTETLSGAQAPEEPRAKSSSIRTRSTPSYSSASAVGGAWSGAPAASPRVTAAQAMTGERHEDSVLFSTANLQQVAMTTNQPGYSAAAAPGFASGEASGLIDIRALASLARQTAPQIAPGAAYDRFRADDDSRMAVMNQTGAFNRVDSLAPVSTPATGGSAAVPLAILGGFALVAAAAFAAILITREARESASTVAVVPDPATTATAAQPTVTPEPELEPAAAVAEEPPAAAEPPAEEPSPQPAAAEDEPSEELASGKSKRQRGARAAEDDEKSKTVPADKAKPKKEEKAPPPSIDEVMVAEKPATPEKAEPEAPKPEPAAAKPSSAASDIDVLLAGTSKPAAKPSSRDRSIDDLLSGAVDDKKAAVSAPTPAASAEPSGVPADEGVDMPATPSRDEVLAAMRGIESEVRACDTENVRGTAHVQITVAGSTGRVTNATVTGITGEVGSCIARAARNAKFGRFSKPTFSVKYPYRFQ